MIGAMLRCVAETKNGRQLLLLGFSAENVRRLQQDQPIRIDLEPLLGIKADAVIYTGTTEEQMAADLQHLIGPDTTVTTDPRLHSGSD